MLLFHTYFHISKNNDHFKSITQVTHTLYVGWDAFSIIPCYDNRLTQSVMIWIFIFNSGYGWIVFIVPFEFVNGSIVDLVCHIGRLYSTRWSSTLESLHFSNGKTPYTSINHIGRYVLLECIKLSYKWWLTSSYYLFRAHAWLICLMLGNIHLELHNWMVSIWTESSLEFCMV